MVLSMAPLRVGFLGYEQANALDLVGPAEAFASAFRDNGKGKFERCYEVSIIGLTRRSFAAESGIVFQPTTTIENAPKLDTLIIPGGCGLRLPDVNRKVAGWILGTGEDDATHRFCLHRHLRIGGDGIARWPSRHDALAFCDRCREAVPEIADGAERLVREGRAVLQFGRSDSGNRSRAGADRGGFRIEGRALRRARDGRLPETFRRTGTIFRAVAVPDEFQRSVRGAGRVDDQQSDRNDVGGISRPSRVALAAAVLSAASKNISVRRPRCLSKRCD